MGFGPEKDHFCFEITYLNNETDLSSHPSVVKSVAICDDAVFRRVSTSSAWSCVTVTLPSWLGQISTKQINGYSLVSPEGLEVVISPSSTFNPSVVVCLNARHISAGLKYWRRYFGASVRMRDKNFARLSFPRGDAELALVRWHSLEAVTTRETVDWNQLVVGVEGVQGIVHAIRSTDDSTVAGAVIQDVTTSKVSVSRVAFVPGRSRTRSTVSSIFLFAFFFSHSQDYLGVA